MRGFDIEEIFKEMLSCMENNYPKSSPEMRFQKAKKAYVKRFEEILNTNKAELIKEMRV